MTRLASIALVLCVLPAASRSAAPTPVGDAEEAAWLRWLIPLPKKIAIAQKVVVPADGVSVELRDGAGDVEANARDQLLALLEEKAGARPQGAEFRIVLGVCDAEGRPAGEAVPGVSELRRRRNSDQAYVIRAPEENHLVVTGLTERGVFHGAMTLRRLLEPKLHDGLVEIPLARVTDWPDLAERGEWGGSANGDALRFAREKMNLIESHCRLTVTPEGRGEASIDPERVEQARLHAVKIVPIITHLDQLSGTRIYEVFPELKGIGPKAGSGAHSTVVAPCASKPKFTAILADWLSDLASHQGVDTVCCWLSELHVQCGCEDCQRVGQYVLETQALVKGWRQARETHPDLKLRILLTQGSYSTNDQVIAATPPEVQISYYDGGRTYDSSRDEMIYPLLEDYCADGRWLGCYPQLTASWRIVCPWSGPQFIRSRMTEFVDDGLQGLCGYATPHNDLYDFNVSAAAEWSWNSKGRDERQFAAAWATRRGISDPDAAAEWAVTLGPVGWDVYGSRVPYSAFFGEAGRMVSDRRAPGLGGGMYRYFPSLAHIEQDIRTCDHALEIAEGLGASALVAETKTLRGYLRMLRELHDIATAAAAEGLPDDSQRQALQDHVTRLSQAATDTNDALRAWEVAASGGNHYGGPRFQDTLDVNDQTVADVAKALAPLGISDPAAPFRRRVIGAWESDDFEENEAVTKRWEVTDAIRGEGEYEVSFRYASGWNGLYMMRAALAAAPQDDLDELRELAVDEHRGSAAYKSEANLYSLRLEAYDPALQYFVIADIKGVRSGDKRPDRRGCNGEVSMRKLRAGDEPLPAPRVGSVDESLQALYRPPEFAGDGINVGVVHGGYGSGSIVESLREVEGIDARSVGKLTPEWIGDCRVLILPQPHAVDYLKPADVKLLEALVRDGGGLITTHNAVGYRGHPEILPGICKGLQHVRDAQWVASADHPLTTGIPRETPLDHAYYDHIELAAGPDGTIVAVAAESKRPVVVCGETGNGRYVACGLLPGVGRESDREVPVTGAELKLLVNAINWCAEPR